MGRLTDKYCIVGVGETSYSKNSGKTTRAMGAEAIRNAMRDAGLGADQVNGVLSYHGGDSTAGPEIAADLGIRPGFLHGLLRWWLEHRGAGRPGHRCHRGGDV